MKLTPQALTKTSRELFMVQGTISPANADVGAAMARRKGVTGLLSRAEARLVLRSIAYGVSGEANSSQREYARAAASGSSK